MKKHIASWLSNMSVATFVLAMFQASDTSMLFGQYTQYAALACSVLGFILSLCALPKKED